MNHQDTTNTKKHKELSATLSLSVFVVLKNQNTCRTNFQIEKNTWHHR